MKLFYSMQYKYSDLHEIYLVFLSQFNTLASEVKCLRVIERRDLSNEQGPCTFPHFNFSYFYLYKLKRAISAQFHVMEFYLWPNLARR